MKTTLRMQPQSPYQARCRKGIAPLELALALPILMVMLSIIFGVCSVTQSRMEVTISARDDAFKKRHQPWEHGAETFDVPYVQKVDAILRQDRKMPSSSGLVSGVGASVPQGLFGPLKILEQQLTATAELSVFGGGWDHQEIEFKKHNALTLTEKAKCFGVTASELDAFKKLGGFGGGGGSSFGQVQGQVQRTLQNASQEITARLGEIDRQLKQLTRQINQQKQQLEILRKTPFADPSEIRSLDQQVKKTQSRIDNLKSEQAQQRKAASSLGVDSSLPAVGTVFASEEE